ncbi:MAG TPA: stage V sporulation protein AD [Patescibacteria group bacterium]|nr:stage V sporulation protein AD [Patescibacteria group bacterium]
MAQKRLGKQTIKLLNPPSMLAAAAVVGPKEGEGPLSQYFDMIQKDDYFGQDSWEKAESKFVEEAVKRAISKSGVNITAIDYMFAGDLLNQIISSSFAARTLQIPFLGLYGACSTMAESLSIGSMIIDGGYADHVICATSSHFSSAERQYRFPLEQGVQRPPFAQWTVTGSGATVLSSTGNGPYITCITTGKVVDFGIKDANNMGAAMAPAAVDTLTAHFKETGREPGYYDLIVTGDLATVGKEITMELLQKEGLDVKNNYNDCGCMIFDNLKQDTHSGGSGCGCSASVLNGYLYNMLKHGELKRLLFVATGALLSPTTAWQGESIPCIAHAVAIETTLSEVQ